MSCVAWRNGACAVSGNVCLWWNVRRSRKVSTGMLRSFRFLLRCENRMRSRMAVLVVVRLSSSVSVYVAVKPAMPNVRGKIIFSPSWSRSMNVVSG